MTYLDLLKKLLPFGVYSDSDSLTEDDLVVMANALQRCQDNADALLIEIYPDTAAARLSDWERVYEIKDISHPLFQRQQTAHAAHVAKGSLKKSTLQKALKPFLGYEPEIENYAHFYSEDENSLTSDDGTDVDNYAGNEDALFDFTVIVDSALVTTSGFAPVAIQNIIDKLKPAHTDGLLDMGNDGFYTDQSLTELDLTSET